MTYARGAVLARMAADHPAQVVALAGGLGYMLGYVNVRAMAAGLGVGPSDLGLTTTDYIVSAAFWVLVFTPLVAGPVWLQRVATSIGWRSATGLSTALMTVGIAVLSIVTAATAVSPTWGVIMLFVVAITASAGWWLGGAGLSVVLALAVSLVGVFLPIAYESGREMRRHPELGETTPVWLKIVLAFDEGEAEFPAGAECALRLSERVYVTDATVRIEPSAVAFRSERCFSAP